MNNIPHSQEPHEELPPTDEEMLARRWAQFQSEFPPDADCREQLYKGTSAFDVLRCRSCTSADVSTGTNGRTINCNACTETTSLTAGTFFSYVKRPRAWWAAIWLREHGVKLNASQFERLLDIAYSSAWNILRKLDMVIAGEMPADAATFLPSAFTRAICKRSAETPARAHPVAEIAELEKELPDDYDANASCSSADQSARSPGQDATDSESAVNLISDSRQKRELGLDVSTGDAREMHIALGT